MSNRSLNGLSSDITNVYINTNLTATLPLEENQSNFNNPIVISLKGITGFTGSAGNVLKSNATNSGLIWGVDSNTEYSATSPIDITGTVVSLSGLNGYGVAGQVLKTNGVSNTVGWFDEQDTVYSFQNPLVNFSNSISLSTVETGKGGTGIISYNIGDILYYSSGNTLNKLGIGLTDQVLTVNTGVPSWEDTQAPDLTLSKDFGTAVLVEILLN